MKFDISNCFSCVYTNVYLFTCLFGAFNFKLLIYKLSILNG